MRYDAIVIGAGHNGLVCAWYLAKMGLKIRVLERLPVPGGAAVTEEFYPGFRNSVAAYTVSLLQSKIIRDMGLERHGLRIVSRPMENFLPLEKNDSLVWSGDVSARQEQVARFSRRDAAAMPDFLNILDEVGGMFRSLMLKAPVNAGGGITDFARGIRDARLIHRLGLSGQRHLLDFLTTSAGELLDRYFESDPIKAALGFDAIVGNYVSPYTPGNAYVLVHHAIGEINGRKGAWGHAIGGMGAITGAMAAACREQNVAISLSTPVQKVLVEDGKAIGVALDNGDTLHAKCVVSNLNPKLLYTRLVDPGELDKEFLIRISRWKCRSGSFRMNVALSELPDFACKPGKSTMPHHGAGIIIAPTLRYMDQAYDDARKCGWSRRPVIELVIPSVYDPTLAPAGRHVASLFCQHFAFDLPEGRDWDGARDEAADLIIKTVNDYAPNFGNAILGRSVLTPLDLERRFGMTGGDIFHGALSLDQIYSARPMLGYANYRGPVRRLYTCGAGTHPGGGVSGAPGHNAAREIIRDL